MFSRTVRALAILGACLLVSAAPALASGYFLELDLDGVPGNGPDSVTADVGDIIPVDVWAYGPEDLISFGITVCSEGSHLLGTVYSSLPGTWQISPEFIIPSCRHISATDFTGTMPIGLPRLVATIQARPFAGSGAADLTVEPSGWVNAQIEDGLFENNIGATIIVGGTTASDVSTWSSIKELFR